MKEAIEHFLKLVGVEATLITHESETIIGKYKVKYISVCMEDGRPFATRLECEYIPSEEEKTLNQIDIRLKEIKGEINEAVIKEDYEKCSRLRDERKELLKQRDSLKSKTNA